MGDREGWTVVVIACVDGLKGSQRPSQAAAVAGLKGTRLDAAGGRSGIDLGGDHGTEIPLVGSAGHRGAASRWRKVAPRGGPARTALGLTELVFSVVVGPFSGPVRWAFGGLGAGHVGNSS